MCTRYTIASGSRTIENEFQAEFQYSFEKTYNAHFGHELPVILAGEESKIVALRWGLVPFWSKEPNLKYHNVNSTARTIVKNAAYRVPVRRRRCLVLANCYYVWAKIDREEKTPFVVYDGKQRLLSFAGIWDSWVNQEKSQVIQSFSIITAPAIKRLRPYSRNMPVIISPGRRRKYLRCSTTLMEVMRMLRPQESDSINLYPVSMKVNDFNENTREVLLPIGQRVYQEYDYVPKVYLKLEGMGSMKDNPDRKPEIKIMI
jgi:putative SOS response-associated peptidase YedK